MGVFSFNFRDIFQFKDLDSKEYELICAEFNKVVNSYSIKTELYSSKVWDYLTERFDIRDEKNVMTFTEIEMDEKNKKHKLYKYVVKCEIDKTGHPYVYLVFNDELRGYDDTDYLDYVTEEDKLNKIYSLTVYYDCCQISTKELEDDIVKELLDCSYLPSTKNQFFTIATNNAGFTLKPSYIKDMTIDLELNYGSKFLPVHEKILDKLKNEKHGLFLLHGETGTGKSSYLRKLISILSEDKTIVYVPSYMIENIADPSFISFVGGFKNVVLLLEDAENVLVNTIDNRSQAVSNILNMTDGLLNDYMNVQIIATFNTNAKMIDAALKRAGRLQVNYKFGKLSKTDANKLAKEVGIDRTFDCASTLAEIYQGTNQIIDDLEEPKIGFGYKK